MLCNRVKYVFSDFCRARSALALQSFLAIFGRECVLRFSAWNLWIFEPCVDADVGEVAREMKQFPETPGELLNWLFIQSSCSDRRKFLFASCRVVQRTTSMRKLMIISRLYARRHENKPCLVLLLICASPWTIIGCAALWRIEKEKEWQLLEIEWTFDRNNVSGDGNGKRN